ncbi:carbohydrate sulfotransferase 9-like [Haliotis cracherodii]|uniref:carbohydrate sulfotransferase 9-like n=1 Tax=Haliotis cracherodii TaxID=6455 RepID=UPI0039E8E320
MVIRSKHLSLFGLFGCLALPAIWILHGFYIVGNNPVAVPVHQKLQLRLNLPKDVTDRDVIVKQYIHNLRTQLQDRINRSVIFIRNQEKHEDTYKKRKEHLTKYCQKQAEDQTTLNTKIVRKHHWFLEEPRIMYCPVAKSGSTFWRRAFEVVRRKDPKVVSPFQLSYIDFKESNAKIPLNMTEAAHADDMSKLLETTLKFIFARDPYSRVFSTFIDKVLSPNRYMWSLGKKAIEMFRSSYTNGTETCGSDVTFDEYIKYLNTLNSKSFDVHIRPVAYCCDACSVDYDVIGKIETFQDDTRYILQKSGSYDKDIIFKDVNTEYKVDYIVDAVVRAFSFRNGWSRCISVHAGYQRLWRQLQIGGMIEKIDLYPLSPEQSNNITVTEYLDMALDAFKRSGPSAKANKKEAFLQAYSMVTLNDMENLREKYIADFEMFDYNQRPEELFKVNRDPVVDFDYFDVMRMK